jgi:hypothetical protein
LASLDVNSALPVISAKEIISVIIFVNEIFCMISRVKDRVKRISPVHVKRPLLNLENAKTQADETQKE